MVKLDPKRSETSYGGGAEAARVAHNHEVTGSKPVLRIITLRPFTEAGTYVNACYVKYKRTFHRYGVIRQHVVHLGFQNTRSMLVTGNYNSVVLKKQLISS